MKHEVQINTNKHIKINKHINKHIKKHINKYDKWVLSGMIGPFLLNRKVALFTCGSKIFCHSKTLHQDAHKDKEVLS